MKAFEIKLRFEEVKLLKSIVSKGVGQARKITRCRVLLLCNENKRRGIIASMLGINAKTVSNICHRYVEEGLGAAIDDRPIPGHGVRFDGKIRAKITALACSTPPEGYSRWSLRLLSDKAVELSLVDSISHTGVGRILKKTM